jgi:hypothetical protein
MTPRFLRFINLSTQMISSPSHLRFLRQARVLTVVVRVDNDNANTKNDNGKSVPVLVPSTGMVIKREKNDRATLVDGMRDRPHQWTLRCIRAEKVKGHWLTDLDKLMNHRQTTRIQHGIHYPCEKDGAYCVLPYLPVQGT